jgi:hypothetical protein
VTLSPPPDPPDDLWLGYLGNAGLRRGPLKVHVPKGQKLWFGTPVVAPRATVTAFFPNDTVGRLSTSSMLHPGFG